MRRWPRSGSLCGLSKLRHELNCRVCHISRRSLKGAVADPPPPTQIEEDAHDARPAYAARIRRRNAPSVACPQVRDAKWAILAAIALVISLVAALAPYLRAQAHDAMGRASDGEYRFVGRGRGWGRGRGLSQYGAYRAARLGKSAQAITDFYYGRSRLATLDRTMRILLSATNGDRFVRFPNATRLSAMAHRADGPVLVRRALAGLAWWRVITDSSGLRVQYLDGSAWRNVSIHGSASFARVSVWATNPLALYGEDGGSRAYRGSYHVTRFDARRIRVVNHVALETQYLRSVVPSETPASWPHVALGAQAIAPRGYAARAHDERLLAVVRRLRRVLCQLRETSQPV
jgi:hypothetical protein